MPSPFVVPVPLLETARLKLRGHRMADFPYCAAMWADPMVTRHFGGKPFSEEESWTRLLRYVGHWAMLGFGYWVLEEKASGNFVGELGFADYKREIQPSLGGSEIGWVLTAQAHHQGYATEAALAAIEWSETSLGAMRTTCIIHPENLPSIRVAEKCGYQEVRRATYKGQPTIVFERYAAS